MTFPALTPPVPLDQSESSKQSPARRTSALGSTLMPQMRGSGHTSGSQGQGPVRVQSIPLQPQGRAWGGPYQLCEPLRAHA